MFPIFPFKTPLAAFPSLQTSCEGMIQNLEFILFLSRMVEVKQLCHFILIFLGRITQNNKKKCCLKGGVATPSTPPLDPPLNLVCILGMQMLLHACVGMFGELAARGNQDSVEIVFFFSLLSYSQLQSFAVFFLLPTTDYFWQLLLLF